MPLIREARSADSLAIARVEVAVWRNAYAGLLPNEVLVQMSERSHTAQWAGILGQRRGRDIVLVVEKRGEGVVGFGSCGRQRETRLPHAGEVYTLYLRPEYQDKGIGRMLLLRLFNALMARNMTSAAVWVLADNPARFFYEAMGGRLVAERDEKLWNTVLHQAAYGWDDLARITASSKARRAR